MRITIISLAFLVSLPTFSQSDSVYYEIPIYFEDAIGNRDTVHLGLSEFANPEFNPSLGEINLVDVPFDSIFEVRLVIFDELAGGDLPSYLGKKHVLPIRFTEENPNTCNGLRIHDHASFVVNSKHPPIKISWNSRPFREGGDLRCLGGSWINNTHAPLTFFGWEDLHFSDDAFSFGCMADWSGEVTITPSNLVPFEGDTIPRGYGSNPFQDYTVLPVEGSNLAGDTMLIYNLWWSDIRGTLCSGLVSVENPDEVTIPVEIYPNPTYGQLFVKTFHHLEPDFISVYSINGKLLKIFSKGLENLNVSDLPPGFFLLRAEFRDGKNAIVKFTKN